MELIKKDEVLGVLIEQEEDPDIKPEYIAGWNDCIEHIEKEVYMIPEVEAIPVEWMKNLVNGINQCSRSGKYLKSVVMYLIEELKFENEQTDKR